MKKIIGIVGAGFSGLLACKYVLSKGFYPIVFESGSDIGGVWTQTMDNTKLQTIKQYYQFSDFPWPSSIKTSFPNSQQVLEYLEAYAKQFDLIKHIKFNCKVISLKYEGVGEKDMQNWTHWSGNGEPFGGGRGWSFALEDLITHSIQVLRVDFAILCVGRFSQVPNIPIFAPGKGPEVCEAKVMHAVDYCGLDSKSAISLVKGKQVTVIGYGKTALDIAMQCSTINGEKNSCTMICRTSRWNIPETFLWKAPLKFIYLSRFAELVVRKPGDGLLLFFIAFLLWPLRWAICKIVEKTIVSMHQLKKHGLLPERNFLTELNLCLVSITPNGFYDKLEEGSIKVKKCSKFYFCKQGITLLDENLEVKEIVRPDLVVLATGYKGGEKVKEIFASSNFQEYIMGPNSALVTLYRECVHPRIPQLAVIGFSDSISCLYSSELSCRWLVELLDQKFWLPSIKEMEEKIHSWDKFMKEYSNYSRRRCVGPLHIGLNDLLCKDMGLNPNKKKYIWAELFEPYGPMDYV